MPLAYDGRHACGGCGAGIAALQCTCVARRAERYAAAIKAHGYANMLILAEASEADIIEMTEDPDITMKKPHCKAIFNVVRTYT